MPFPLKRADLHAHVRVRIHAQESPIRAATRKEPRGCRLLRGLEKWVDGGWVSNSRTKIPTRRGGVVAVRADI